MNETPSKMAKDAYEHPHQHPLIQGGEDYPYLKTVVWNMMVREWVSKDLS